ncbi:hypothetical protein MLD63_07115 [Paracoccus sp. TK19116]|uniref:Uncharacterized protein n=1 Tax=Paracoccus albicereus TaxID=2922394 RepID=A0ABT1MS57_9RHOB|nr:hypothetical protein [Paracoccus albicereus]MCQ0970188.1 hypothetical protein [Paracoccus albicereus]
MLPAILLLVIGIGSLVIATVARADARGRYLVVMRDSVDAATVMDAVYQHGGGVTGFTWFSRGLYAVSDAPDFAMSMRASGAWMVWALPNIPGCFGTVEVRS